MTVDLEFLIQKEGDFEWLPLESVTVEILVGRYQCIAQASEANTPIEVHIRHQYVQEGIWQEEVHQQLLRTDSQGRIEVLPPTFLQHGRWIISCTPTDSGHLAATENCHCVQLHVLEQENDIDQAWELLDIPLPSVDTYPDLDLRAAELLSPLQALDIKSKTAWNNLNLTPSEEIILSSVWEKELEATSPSPLDSLDLDLTGLEPTNLLDELASLLDFTELEPASLLDFTKLEPTHLLDSTELEPVSLTPPTEPIPVLPTLPIIPKDVPPLRLQISPGLILPPELYSPNPIGAAVSPPQLPVFPHLDHWQTLSYKELAIALGRLYWSKLDAYGQTIDLDFMALDLQSRFLQTLNGLAFQNAYACDLNPDLSIDPLSTPLGVSDLESALPVSITAIVPASTAGES
jgi:hypothetical protein